jgi:endonuclease/exonuclease/phosphatase (EEP) superfamily protein YafD
MALATALYAFLLAAAYVAQRVVGERFWGTSVVLYVPSVGFGVPLLVLVPLCLRQRRWMTLLALGVCTAFWSVLLMDYHGLPGTRRCGTPSNAARVTRSSAPLTVRLVTQNAHSLRTPIGVVQQLREIEPDVVLLQEADERPASWWQQQLPRLKWVQHDEFLLGTTLRVEAVHLPDRILTNIGFHKPRYVRYQLERAGTRFFVYNVHTPSPQVSLFYLLHQIRTAAPVSPAISSLWLTTEARLQTLRALADDAAAQAVPVIVAGDTNLPQLSSAFHEVFHEFDDAFACAGRGYGYTFPAYRGGFGVDTAWLRLDRVLGRNGVLFEAARTLPASDSDHKALFVEAKL